MTVLGVMAIPEGQWCRLDNDIEIHYHDVGKGPVVLFVHGSGPGASGYSNFRNNYPVFCDAGYRVVVPDLVGYGYSSKPVDREYSLDFYLECIQGLLQHLGVSRCAVVGNSLGGAIAIALALDRPDTVTRLILMAPGGIEERSVYQGMNGIRAMMAGFLGEAGLDRAGLRSLLQLQLFDHQRLSQVLDQAVAERFPILQQQPVEVLSTLRVPDLSSELGRISCPILGFWGVNDEFCPVAGAMKLLTHCRRTRFQLIAECGHWVMVEHAELFNRECLAFLAE